MKNDDQLGLEEYSFVPTIALHQVDHTYILCYWKFADFEKIGYLEFFEHCFVW